jgi:hypothetical protein
MLSDTGKINDPLVISLHQKLVYCTLEKKSSKKSDFTGFQRNTTCVLACYDYVAMGLLHEIQKMGETIGKQFTTRTKPGGQGIYFTNNFQERARSWKLSERDATDVYYHGQEVKANMKVRKYNGYELGIYYFLDKDTSQPVITSIWKRARR